uniref:Putative protease n=1 Tax=viral metagenome TaxID=1070528 RepID=A0A6M3IMR1_9ZZZZ
MRLTQFIRITGLLFLVFLIVLVFSTPVLSEEKEKHKTISICPKTKIEKQENCFDCHTKPSFKLREAPPWEGWDYPKYVSFLFIDKKPVTAVIRICDIASDIVSDGLQYAKRHGVRHIIIEVDSWGGGLFEGWRISGYIREYMRMGYDIESRCYGKAFSAGFLIFVTPDKRLAARTAELMWHEAWTFEWQKISTKSTKEEELKVLRHLQDTANAFVASRTDKMTKQDVDKKIRHSEFWVNGEQAAELGFVTGFLD